MNKNELIMEVATQADLSKSQAAAAVQAVLDVIEKTLQHKDEVRLVGFGTFCTSERKATEGRNPRTGEKLQIPASYVPKFKPGKGLKQKVAA